MAEHIIIFNNEQFMDIPFELMNEEELSLVSKIREHEESIYLTEVEYFNTVKKDEQSILIVSENSSKYIDKIYLTDFERFEISNMFGKYLIFYNMLNATNNHIIITKDVESVKVLLSDLDYEDKVHLDEIKSSIFEFDEYSTYYQDDLNYSIEFVTDKILATIKIDSLQTHLREKLDNLFSKYKSK